MSYRVGEIFDDDAKIVDVRRGGMGVVYVCEGQLGETSGRFAIKTFSDIEPRLKGTLDGFLVQTDTARLRRRFIEEGVNNLDLPLHPNLVNVFAVQHKDGLPYLLMEYVDGGNLRDRIDGGKLELRLVLSYALQTAHALDLAFRERGLIHRDIKPENILITTEGVVKVADFGLAMGLAREVEQQATATLPRSAAEAHASIAQVIGTLPYMAPEQVVAPDSSSVRSDIYALGVVLYEMLSGQPPFHVASLEQALRATTAIIPPPVKTFRHDVPDELSAFVAQCLSKRPSDRFADYSEVTRHLTTIAASLNVEVSRPSSYEIDGAPLVQIFRKAIGLINLGRNREAVSHLEHFNYEELGSPELFHVAGTAYGNLDENEKAVSLYDRSLSGGSYLRKRTLHNKGNSLLALNKLEEAVACYREAFALDPTYHSALIGLAQAAFTEGDYAKSARYCDHALLLRFDTPMTWRLMALSLFRTGEKAAAEESLQIAAESCSETPTMLYLFADAYAGIANPGRAGELILRYLDASAGLQDELLDQVLALAVRVGDDAVTRQVLQRVLHSERFDDTIKPLNIPDLIEMRIDILIEKERLREAMRLIETELEERPGSRSLILRKAEVLKHQEEFGQAADLLGAFLNEAPTDVHAHQLLGEVLFLTGRFEEALGQFDRCIDLVADRDGAYVSRASTLMELGRFDEALADCEKALQAQPADIGPYLLKGRILNRSGDHASAARWLEASLRSTPDDPRLLDELSASLMELGRYPEAVHCCSRILQAEPKNAAAWHNKGEAYLRLSRPREAVECYMNAVAIKKDLYASYVGIGVVHLILKNYEPAVAFFKKALKYKPDFTPAISNLMIAQTRWQIQIGVEQYGFNEGELIKSLEETLLRDHGIRISLGSDEIIDLNTGRSFQLPKNAGAEHAERRRLAFQMADEGRLEEATTLFKRVVHDSPSDYESWHALGVCYDESGRYTEAITCFDQALSSAPAGTISIETLNSKGEVLRKLGRCMEAIALYDEVLKHDPGHEFALNNKGICLKNFGRYHEARECYRMASEANPNSWRALLNLAMLELHADDEQAALEAAEQLKSLPEDNALIHCGIGVVYLNLGRIAAARAELEKAKELDPKNPHVLQLEEAINSPP